MIRILLILAGVAAVALLLGRVLLRTPPADLARRLRIAGGAVLMLFGGGLMLARQFAIGLPVGIAGFMILRREMDRRGGGSSGAARRSGVRSQGLDMSLDHDTGEMDGRILQGRFEGKMLSQLALPDLIALAADFSGDADSLRLLESYLDRAHPGWREDVHEGGARRQRAAPGAGGMSTQEAYEVLGLEPDAGEAEVREAHRRLMKQVHPDRGGSHALAAKINEAKDRILGEHR